MKIDVPLYDNISTELQSMDMHEEPAGKFDEPRRYRLLTILCWLRVQMWKLVK
jgi:hypothetical protein